VNTDPLHRPVFVERMSKMMPATTVFGTRRRQGRIATKPAWVVPTCVPGRRRTSGRQAEGAALIRVEASFIRFRHPCPCGDQCAQPRCQSWHPRRDP